MIEARLFVDDAVGETRRLLTDLEGRAFRLDVERWSERANRARVGELWNVRVLEAAPDGDWFIDLGPGGQGLLRPGKGEKLTSGAYAPVRIRAEAQGDKGVVAEVAKVSAQMSDTPARMQAADSDAFLRGVEVTEHLEGSAARAALDAALEEGLSEGVDLPSGGRLWLETTRSVTAIDVDRCASRAKSSAINMEATAHAGRQISLRSIGGVVIVDFVGAPRKPESSELSDTFRTTVRDWSLMRADSLGLSRFGLLQAAVPRGRRSLAAAMDCPSAEREALDALRELESEGWSHRSARFEVRLSEMAERWLRSSLPDWEDQLGERIGRRWRVSVGEVQAGRSAVRMIE